MSNHIQLLKTGERAMGKILSLQDTNITINEQPRVKIEIEIQPSIGSAFKTTKTATLPRIALPRVGDSVYVVYAKDNPNDFAFSRQPLPSAEEAEQDAATSKPMVSETRKAIQKNIMNAFVTSFSPFLIVLVCLAIIFLIPWSPAMRGILLFAMAIVVTITSLKTASKLKKTMTENVLSLFRPALEPGEGERAKAKIVSMQDTYATLNENPVVQFEFEVHPTYGTDFKTTAEIMISRLMIQTMKPGDEIAIRFDPKNPKRVVLDE